MERSTVPASESSDLQLAKLLAQEEERALLKQSEKVIGLNCENTLEYEGKLIKMLYNFLYL